MSRTGTDEPHVFDDPEGDPFIKWVELDGKWYRIDESVLVEWEEEIITSRLKFDER